MNQRFNWNTLFKQQVAARDASVSLLSIEDRIQIIMACGTGKSRVGPAIANEVPCNAVVVYVPSLALVRQIMPEWMYSDFGCPVTYLCVCSDESVRGDIAVVTPDELREQLGLAANSVTTSPDVVRAFLGAPTMAMRIVFCTYQSADTLSAGIPEGFRFDLGVFDEAHRTAGKTGMFTGPLQDTHTPIAKRVFMTATPKHISLRKKNKDGEGSVVYSMDDEAVYGKVAYRLPIREAIDQQLIADYKVLVSVIDNSMLPESWQQKIGRSEASMEDVEMVAHAIALDDAMKRFGLKKAVTFHNTVEEARQFTEESRIRDVLTSGTERFHVSGAMPSSLRGQQMEAFASTPQAVITNARCLTEGIDVPAIDLVAFLHPRKSHVDIIQAIGRALRLPRGSRKTTGYILLPLYVSEIDNGGLEKALEESGYDTIYQVIQALREQDEKIDTILRETVWQKTADQPAEWPFLEFSGPVIHLDYLRKAISVHCLDVIMESWETYFGVLNRRFDNGEDINVPADTEIDGLKVGSWESEQRKNYKAGKLSDGRISRLEALGFVWNTHDAIWDRNCSILERLAAEGKSINVPKNTKIDGLNIGRWKIDQRQARKSNKLSVEQIARLNAIGFVWDVLEADWDKCCSVLERLAAEGKSVNVPQHTEIDGLKIGIWNRRQRHVKKAGKLSAERIARLEAIGFIWDVLEASWDEHCRVLERLAAEGKSVNVPRHTEIDGLKVEQWTGEQRKAKKAGRLSAERIARLDAIGFIWDVLEADWDKCCSALERLAAEGKSVNVPKRTEIDGLKVGKWSGTQRRTKKAGKLSAERIARLDAIGFIWDVLEADRDKCCSVLERLAAEGKSVNVPQRIEIDGLKVGQWASVQRQAKKAGKLSAERIARLDAIGFVWDALEASWDEHCRVLERLAAEGKSVNVPQRIEIDGLKVGQWSGTQRRDKKSGKLSAERIARLEAIGFKWSLK